MTTLQIFAALTALAGLALGVQTYRLEHAVERAELWERSAQASQAALREMQSTYDALGKALAEREKKLTEVNKALTANRKKLKELEHEQAVADWGRTAVPDAVDRLLKGSADAHGDSPGAP